MLRWGVRQLAQQRGFDTAYKLALAAGLPYNSVKAIWDGKAKRVDLDTLSKLCKALNAGVEELIKELAARRVASGRENHHQTAGREHEASGMRQHVRSSVVL